MSKACLGCMMVLLDAELMFVCRVVVCDEQRLIHESVESRPRHKMLRTFVKTGYSVATTSLLLSQSLSGKTNSYI